MKFLNWKRIIQLLPIICILCLAAYLRLHRIQDYMTFLGDEGRDVLIVKRMIVDHKLTLLGPTASVGGFFMGPIYYYFMLPFLWAWNLNPVGPAVMVAFFGIATVGLIYIIGKEWFSKGVGLIASLLYALSPIVIAYSRSSWNPNIVPFFALASVYFLEKWRDRKKVSHLFIVGLCAGIGIQLHYIYLFLIVTEGLFLAYHYKKVDIKALLMLLAGFVLGFSPFLAFEFRHGFTNTRAIFEFVFAGKDTGFSMRTMLGTVRDVATRLFGRFLLTIPESGTLGNLPYTTRTLWICTQTTLTVIGFVALIKETKKYRLIMMLWFLVPLLFFGLYRKNIYDYYFGIFFPLPFFLTALSLQMVSRIRVFGKFIAGIMLISLIVLNWQGRPFRYEPNRQLAQVELISKAVVEKTENKPFNFALVTTGNSDHAYRYFFEIWNKSPVVIENSVVDPGRKTVTEQLLIVCEDIFCQPLGNSLWEVAGFGRAEIVGVWDVSVVKIYKLVHYKELNQK